MVDQMKSGFVIWVWRLLPSNLVDDNRIITVNKALWVLHSIVEAISKYSPWPSYMRIALQSIYSVPGGHPSVIVSKGSRVSKNFQSLVSRNSIQNIMANFISNFCKFRPFMVRICLQFQCRNFDSSFYLNISFKLSDVTA